jgi:hypothetical protein
VRQPHHWEDRGCRDRRDLFALVDCDILLRVNATDKAAATGEEFVSSSSPGGERRHFEGVKREATNVECDECVVKGCRR